MQLNVAVPQKLISAAVAVASPAEILSPAVSPDGGAVAFSSNKGGAFAIYMYSIGRGELKQLTSPESGIDIEPAFPPDGKSVYFTSNQGGQFDIYQIDTDGGAISRITNSPEREVRPVFSPDGRLLCSISANGKYHVYEIDVVTGAATRLVATDGNDLAR